MLIVIVVGAPLVGLGAALYLLYRRGSLREGTGLACFALALYMMSNWRSIWGKHNLFGWMVTLNEYEAMAILLGLIVLGWGLALSAWFGRKRE